MLVDQSMENILWDDENCIWSCSMSHSDSLHLLLEVYSEPTEVLDKAIFL